MVEPASLESPKVKELAEVEKIPNIIITCTCII